MLVHTFPYQPTDSVVQRLDPIILLNGWGLSVEVLKPLAGSLSEITTTLIIDVVYENNADELCKSIRGYLPDHYILMGWSLGGMLATRLAALYPESTRALITLASNLQFVNDKHWPWGMEQPVFEEFCRSFQENQQQTLSYFFSLMVKGDSDRRLQKKHLQRVAELSVSKVQECGFSGLELLASMQNQATIERVNCAALHIFAQNDSLVPVELMGHMQKIKSSHQYFIIDNAGHFLLAPLERLLMVIKPFLSCLDNG